MPRVDWRYSSSATRPEYLALVGRHVLDDPRHRHLQLGIAARWRVWRRRGHARGVGRCARRGRGRGRRRNGGQVPGVRRRDEPGRRAHVQPPARHGDAQRVPLAVGIGWRRFDLHDVARGQFLGRAREDALGVPPRRDQRAAGRSRERFERRHLQAEARVFPWARDGEGVNDGPRRHRRAGHGGDLRGLRVHEARREQRHDLPPGHGANRVQKASQPGERAGHRRRVRLAHHGRGRRCDHRLGLPQALRIADHRIAGGRKRRGICTDERRGINASGCPGERLAGDRLLGVERQHLVLRQRQQHHREAVGHAQAIEQRLRCRDGGALVSPHEARLIHDHEHVPDGLGGVRHRPSPAGASGCGVGNGSRAPAHPADGDNTPWLAVDGDGEVGRSEALGFAALAVQDDDVERQRGGRNRLDAGSSRCLAGGRCCGGEHGEDRGDQAPAG